MRKLALPVYSCNNNRDVNFFSLALHSLCSTNAHVLVMVIHQPRYSIFKLFDSLTLLCRGHIIYQGNPNASIQYFADRGITRTCQVYYKYTRTCQVYYKYTIIIEPVKYTTSTLEPVKYTTSVVEPVHKVLLKHNT